MLLFVSMLATSGNEGDTELVVPQCSPGTPTWLHKKSPLNSTAVLSGSRTDCRYACVANRIANHANPLELTLPSLTQVCELTAASRSGSALILFDILV